MCKDFLISGWIQAMKDLQNDCLSVSKMEKEKTLDFVAGYKSAIKHYFGYQTDKVFFDLGLVKAYRGFYGQSNWEHPSF